MSRIERYGELISGIILFLVFRMVSNPACMAFQLYEMNENGSSF
jgi:hypothetical protein